MSKINLEGLDLANPPKPQRVCIRMSCVFAGRASQTCEMLVLPSCLLFRHLETNNQCIAELPAKIVTFSIRMTSG